MKNKIVGTHLTKDITRITIFRGVKPNNVVFRDTNLLIFKLISPRSVRSTYIIISKSKFFTMSIQINKLAQ